jgi:sec-independent protein translocase protein TatB
MLDFNISEMAIVALVALLVIGPKDLPKAMRVVGHWVGRARGVARQFRAGFDTMVREAELEEMEKKWAAENERIMREHPMPPADAPETPAEGEPEAADIAAERGIDSDVAAEREVNAEADQGGPPQQMTPRP